MSTSMVLMCMSVSVCLGKTPSVREPAGFPVMPVTAFQGALGAQKGFHPSACSASS